MIRQRVFALALGYEDLNDHEQLRQDPLLGAMVGKAQPGAAVLAGKSTLNRMELGTGIATRYKKVTFWRDSVDELLVDLFLEAHPVSPQQIVLDIDTTDMALHGDQEGKFYHGYYKHYCYLPLYIFCGDHVLCARLRPSSIGPAVGSRKEVERIVRQIRQRWPEVEIILRGDSGFCSDQLLSWCEQNKVDYVVGMRLRTQTWLATREWKASSLVLWPKPSSSLKPLNNRPESLSSSNMRRSKARGARSGGWWPRQNTSTENRIRGSS
jgi:hypothetical protein